MDKNKGFTLFELLVSISIIAILTALVSLSYSAVQKRARDARRRQDMESVQKAAEQFYSLSNYDYPGSTNAPADWTVDSQAVLNIFPTDPKGTGWTGYSCSSIGSTGYCCCAALEDDDSGNASNNSCTFASDGSYYCIKNQQ